MPESITKASIIARHKANPLLQTPAPMPVAHPQWRDLSMDQPTTVLSTPARLPSLVGKNAR